VSEHPLADAAAQVLREARAGGGAHAAPPPEPEIAAIADAIRAGARRRRVRAVVASGAALVAAAAAALLLVQPRSHGPGPIARSGAAPEPSTTRAAPATAARGAFTVARAVGASFASGDGARPATAGAAFASGETIVSGAEAVALAGDDGTEVRVAPRSEVALVRADVVRWFQLQSGSLEAHVTKLGAGERFVVATPDRQVEVRGTRFRVSLAPADEACGGGSVTRVAVDEGVVTVRAAGGGEERVVAGGRWPSGDCGAAPAPTAPGARRRLHPRPEPRATATATPAGERAAPSTLAAENDLFGQAARAERAGDATAALRLLDQLIARYPQSPLRETAEAERRRLLEHHP
jgi:hypothetical protein